MKTKNYLLFFLLLYTVSTYASTYEDAEDNSISRWFIPSSATIANLFDTDKSSRVITFNSTSYQYYRFKNPINSSSKNIKWDMKTSNPFFIYILVQTTDGDRLLYYNGINRNYKMSGIAIHHGLGNNAINNQWHTYSRDLDSDIKDFEPNNNFISIKSFKIKAINTFSIDNLETNGDSTPPVITLNGDSNITLTKGSNYIEQNATAIDAVDGRVDVIITGTVDTSTIGSYTLTYTATDNSGNSASIERKIDVVDSNNETIFTIEDAEDSSTNGWTLSSGANIENIYDNLKQSRVIHLYSDSYQYYNIRGLYNRKFKKIRWDMRISGAFFVYIGVTTTSGYRLLYYNAVDKDNGITKTAIHHGLGVEAKNGEWQTFTRNIEQDIKDYEPNNELISIDSFKIRAINDVYVDDIELFGNVDNTPPVITLNGDSVIRILQGDTYVEQNATAIDDRDGNVNVQIIGDVDTSQVRIYLINYIATDRAGNSASKIRVVHVCDRNESSYLYKEGFEDKNASDYLVYKASTNGRFNLSNSKFLFDKSDYTEGNQSLKVEINIPGLGDNVPWYYYLKIPMNPVLDLEGNLSLSMEMKFNSNDSSDVEIGLGLDLPYYPTSSGLKRIFSFKNKKSGIWEHIEMDNIPQETLAHANNWLNKYLYDGDINDIGRALNGIVLLVKGQGKVSCSVNLDNIKIGGTQLNPNDFKSLYTTRWSNYIRRIKGKIAKRIEKRDALRALPDISNFALCSVEQERYNYAKNSLARINDIIDEMNNKILNGYFAPSLMEELDGLLKAYEGTVALLEDSLNNQNQKIKVLDMPSMKYYRLTGDNTPLLSELNGYNLRMTAGEYKSVAMLLVPMCQDAGELHLEISELNGVGSSIPSENLDFYVAKLWYQAGLNTTAKVGKFMTQELLLKDENLVKVDFETENNLLKVKDNNSLNEKYISIGRSTDSFPNTKTITFNDAKRLQPFRFNGSRHKLLWGIVHIPTGTASGEYNATVKIVDSANNVLKEIPININVLPFVLDEPLLKYSLYYIGKLNEQAYPVDSHYKTSAQELLELKDMKKHGVMYPTSYDTLATLNDTLVLRNRVGLPKDRFYTFGLRADRYSMDNIENNIYDYKSILADNGYLADELYLYANEEISKYELKLELDSIRRVHLAGAKTFTAGYNYFYDVLGNDLDMFVYHKGPLNKDATKQVQKWHNSGKEIFAYSAPQAGIENPEVYRRNFGCKLWQKGFDGALNWAYQAKRGAFWNDFDGGSSSFREEAFTYPTTDGIVGTIEWEGFREAITDVRYISTLVNLINRESNSGADVTSLNNFISNIDCNSDLDVLRENIINEIMKLKE